MRKTARHTAASASKGTAPQPARGLDGSAESSDEAYQVAILPAVSRTFALTIPELPASLWPVVTNGYLLCRIADTIEDEPALSLEDKRRLHRRFADAVDGREDAAALAAELAPRLSGDTLPAEHELVRNAARIISVAQRFPTCQRDSLRRCVRIMCEGMPRFQAGHLGRGLEDLREFDGYCYHVAGVVGEMLTELFCAHSPEIDARRTELERLSVSFGQALQMTNILKDVWSDLERGFCWLPRDVFRRAGFDLAELRLGDSTPAFRRGMTELLAVAHAHTRNALKYTLLIPAGEKGIRRFCLWALGMAVLTLRKVGAHLDFTESSTVKITRRSVQATILASNLSVRNDRLLRWMFSLAASKLPAPAFLPPRPSAQGAPRLGA